MNDDLDFRVLELEKELKLHGVTQISKSSTYLRELFEKIEDIMDKKKDVFHDWKLQIYMGTQPVGRNDVQDWKLDNEANPDTVIHSYGLYQYTSLVQLEPVRNDFMVKYNAIVELSQKASQNKYRQILMDFVAQGKGNPAFREEHTGHSDQVMRNMLWTVDNRKVYFSLMLSPS